MGRAAAKLLLLVMIASVSVALAAPGDVISSNQATQTAKVFIPQVAMLRFKTSSTSSTDGGLVDFGTVSLGSLSSSNVGTTYNADASLSSGAELQALVNAGDWDLGYYVSSQSYTFGSTSANDWSTTGMSLGQFQVSQDTNADSTAPVFSPFTLSSTGSAATPTDVVGTSGTPGSKTAGWKNVGISSSSYTFTPTGLEAPGTYTVTLTYVIMQP